MRWMLFISCFFLLGCYTKRKASNQMDKARIKYPELSAQKCATWYPVIPIEVIRDTNAYKEWVRKIDSFSQQIVTHYDTIFTHDTIMKNTHKITNEIITKYNTYLKEMPPIHDTIKVLDKAKMTDFEAQIKDKEAKLTESYTLMNKTLIIGLILLLILFIIAILKK